MLGWAVKTQKELAAKIEVNRDVIANWETNRALPDVIALQNLARVFDISTDELLGIHKQDPINQPIPLIGTIRAGLPILSKENIEGYLEVPDYINADYVLQVKGDSMNGDLAICREESVPQNGQIIVALRDEGSLSEATLKFYMNGNGSPCLRAANPAFADIDFKDGYRTAGTMVTLVRKEALGYHVYKNYIAVPGYDEWTEVIVLEPIHNVRR